jgi:predicted protein tyrosine phosphatase
MSFSFIRYYLPNPVSENVMYYIGKAKCFLQWYINNTFSANEITEKIFIGDLASASNDEAMLEQGITHVVSVINGSYELFPEKFTYKIIHINDDPWVDIGQYFDETNVFIESAIKDPKNKVMIHCHRGISRSVTLLMAYLLSELNKKNKILQDEVDATIQFLLEEVKGRRSIASPNEGFIEALKIYVYKLNGYDLKFLELSKESKESRENKDNKNSDNDQN